MRGLKQVLIGTAVLILSLAGTAGVSYAQSGGPVNIRATDPSTGASINVGSASDNSLRIHIVASDVSSSGGTSAADGATYTAGTTAGTAIQGARDDTAPGTVAEDKLGIVRITTNRAMHINLRDASGTELGVSAAPLQVSLANTGANSTAVKVDGTGGSFPVSGTLTAVTSITNAVSTKPIDACGTSSYDPTSLMIPDATLDTLTLTTTCVDSIIVANVGSASATITVQDVQGTPVQALKAVPIAPGASIVLNGLQGLKFSGGIKYQASASNTLSLWVKGRQ